MGNFYCNFTTQGPSAEEIVGVLTASGRSAYVTPTDGGKTIVFEELSDEFKEDEIDRVGGILSVELTCPVLAVAIADDDEMWMSLYVAGEKQTVYSSRGENRGTATVARAFGRIWVTPMLWLLLQWPYMLVEHWRHAMMAKLLGIPRWCVASGFRYIRGGEPPMCLNESDLQYVGNNK